MSCFRKHGTFFMGREVVFLFFDQDQDQDSLLVNMLFL